MGVYRESKGLAFFHFDFDKKRMGQNLFILNIGAKLCAFEMLLLRERDRVRCGAEWHCEGPPLGMHRLVCRYEKESLLKRLNCRVVFCDVSLVMVVSLDLFLLCHQWNVELKSTTLESKGLQVVNTPIRSQVSRITSTSPYTPNNYSLLDKVISSIIPIHGQPRSPTSVAMPHMQCTILSP